MDSPRPLPAAMRRFERPTFFARLRERTGPLAQIQIDGAETLLAALEADPALSDLREAAYLLATAWHETAYTLSPLVERGSRSYIDARYDPVAGSTPERRRIARRMGNTAPGDGWRYRGRGYVQLTWCANYDRLGKAAGLDLLAEPDLALRPDLAYLALSAGLRDGWYTGRSLSAYLTVDRTDYAGARACVNGSDRAVEIAAHAIAFERALGCAAFAATLGEHSR